MQIILDEYISIHAPPRGATGITVGTVNDGKISIHAPPRGATSNVNLQRAAILISIHAPPRGATRTKCASCKRTSFQFTPLREGRQRATETWDNVKQFQFTPLREGRRRCTECAGIRRYFNSRPSARGDADAQSVQESADISIHAPPRGATARRGGGNRDSVHFNSRPSARGDSRRQVFPRLSGRFQFTPLREGRPSRLREIDSHGAISIHAPPRGATLQSVAATKKSRYFNSRPSARGDG